MDVLLEDVKLPSHLDRLTDTDLDLRRVRGMVRVGSETLFVALICWLRKVVRQRIRWAFLVALMVDI